MPRPGPRPYECVKRAWHSDMHRPMRGSIIQEIFRVVHERHSTEIKKNKEWQEKLPVVVLKAEEIMYSKANSEAEYTDLQTVWARVNDAVDTIIRRDESTESEDLLPPCVEAALHLGCVPVRVSRSQRHSNPRSYLSPRPQELPKISSTSAQELPLQMGNLSTILRPVVNAKESNTQGMLRNIRDNAPVSCNSQLLPLQMGNQSTTLRPDVSGSRNNASTPCSFPFPSAKVSPSSNNQLTPLDNSISLEVGSVYSGQCDAHCRPKMSQFGFQLPRNTNSIINGTPIFPLSQMPAVMGRLQSLVSYEREDKFSNKSGQAGNGNNNNEKSHGSHCDLSLRLGFSEDSTGRLETIRTVDFLNVGVSSPKEADKSILLTHQNKEFPFFPSETASDPFVFHASHWNSEGEGQNARKRKATLDNNMEGGYFSHNNS